jgi:hypothetical protein
MLRMSECVNDQVNNGQATVSGVMNRRELIQRLAVLSFNLAMRDGNTSPIRQTFMQKSRSTQSGADRLPSIVAGVRLVDSKIARLVTDLSRMVSPPYLFNHAVRTFVFGSFVGRALGQKIDEEVLYLACMLHDLGLTKQFQGDLPFEIQGAQAAKQFLEEHKYSTDRIGIVWDGIAMHTSLLGQFKQPEIALVGAGAGADVIGPDPAQIKRTDVEEVVRIFPRLGFKNAFVSTCADVVRSHPKGASRSFMRDIGERYVPDFRPRNFCDLVAQAPFSE